MAPPQADLRKIGVEGFALIDKFYGPPRRNSGNEAFQYGRRERLWVVYPVPNDLVDEPTMNNSKDAAFHHAGVSVVNYPKGKPQNRWDRPFKF